MLKFLVLGVFLSQQVVKGIYGQPRAGVYDTRPAVLLPLVSPLNNDSKKELTQDTDGKYKFYATHQTFYLSPFPSNYSNGSTTNLRKIGADYKVTQGIGAHKLHLHRMTWNRARRHCVEEGGHLAVIRSDAEERILLQMLLDNSIEDAWVGYHDNFEENDWLTVLDEPLLQAGWARWSKKFAVNPDNFLGIQNCAQLLSCGGIDDVYCGFTRAFFCKISIF